MAPIANITNGEGGGSVRAKLNLALELINQTINSDTWLSDALDQLRTELEVPTYTTATRATITTGFNASQLLYLANTAPRIIHNSTTSPIYIQYGEGPATSASPTYELPVGESVTDTFAGEAQVIGVAGATGQIVITRLGAV